MATLGPPTLYSLLAIAMTWPLAAHLTTHISGTGGDGPNFLWRLWWVPYALFERSTSPWHTDLLFHPQGADLIFDTLAPLYGLLSYPLQALAGVVVTYNVLLVVSLVLAAWGSYLLALHLSGDARAALVAGTVFGFSPYLLVHLWGHLNLVAAWPLPIFALCLIRALETGAARWAATAGALLGAASLLDYQYGVFALLWAVLAGLSCLCAQAGAPGLHRAWLPLAAAWLLVFSPLLVPAVQAVASGESPVAGNPGDSAYFSADLLAFALPSTVRWGGTRDSTFETREFQGIGGIEGTTYLGLIPIVLLLFAVRARDPGRSFGLRFWLLSMLLFAILALGPTLHIAGADTRVPLPYALLQQVPYLGTTRVPARFAVMVSLSLAVLAAFGFQWLVARAEARNILCAAAIIAIAAEYAVAPLPLRSVEVPAFYRALGKEPGEFGVVPLPMLLEAGPKGGSLGRGDQLLQYYQVVHHKPMTFGHVARGPQELLDFYQRRPVLRWLGNPDGGPPFPEDLDLSAFAQVIEDLDLRYAVLHKPYYDKVTLVMLRDYFERVFGQRAVWDDADVLAFRLEAPPARDPEVVEEFLKYFTPGVRLVSPGDGAVASAPLPLLRWEPEGHPSPLFEVQVSRDPWFGRTFLYYESVDGRLTNPTFSYRMPAQYPPVPGAVYYWRVRRVEADKPLPWTPAWRFVSR